MADDGARAARQKALAEKKRRLEEIKARRRQPTSATTTTVGEGSSGSGGASTQNLDSYIDNLLNTTAPGLQLPSSDQTTAAATTDNNKGEESKVAEADNNIAEEEKEESKLSEESHDKHNANARSPSPQQQLLPKVETFEIAIQCMEDDFPPPSLVDEEEQVDDDDDSSDEEEEAEQHQILQSTSFNDSILLSTDNIESSISIMSEEEKVKTYLNSQPFTQFLSTASKRVERLLGASESNMYGILNDSGWGGTGGVVTAGSAAAGEKSSSGRSGVTSAGADFSIDYANDEEEYYDTDDDELADGVSATSGAANRKKKRRSKKKTKEEAYQSGGYFTARATYEFPKFTNGRNVTSIEWCPGHKEWVLASYNAVSPIARRDGSAEATSGGGGGEGSTTASHNPTTRHISPLDPSSSFLQTSSSSAIPNEGIVAIYNLSMPSRPEHVFCAGCPILHSQFHPTEHPKLILGGGSSGQVLVWDARVGRYPVQRSVSSAIGGGHDCDLVGMKVLGGVDSVAARGGGTATTGGTAGSITTSKLVTASSDGRVNYWSVSNLREPIETVQVNANLSCLEVLHDGNTEGVVCGDERGGLHTILAGTGRDGSASNKRVIRSLHPGGVVLATENDDMEEKKDDDVLAAAEMGHYGMVTSVSTRPIMPASNNTPRFSTKETTSSSIGGTSKGFLRGAGGLMVTTGVDWSTKLWAPAYTDKPLLSFLSNSYDYMCDAQWSPVHPSIFATASSNGTLNIWNLASTLDQPVSGTEGIPINNSSASSDATMSSRQGLNRIQWSADGRRMAVASGDKLHVLGVGEEVWKSKGDEDGRVMNNLVSRGLIQEE